MAEIAPGKPILEQPVLTQLPAGALGVLTGIVPVEFLSEFAARTAGITEGWKLVGIKALPRALMAIIFLAAAYLTKITGMGALFLKVAGWATIAGLGPDIMMAIKGLGGVEGAAEKLAVRVRRWAMGAEKAAAELKDLEVKITTTTTAGKDTVKVAPSASFR